MQVGAEAKTLMRAEENLLRSVTKTIGRAKVMVDEEWARGPSRTVRVSCAFWKPVEASVRGSGVLGGVVVP